MRPIIHHPAPCLTPATPEEEELDRRLRERRRLGRQQQVGRIIGAWRDWLAPGDAAPRDPPGYLGQEDQEAFRMPTIFARARGSLSKSAASCSVIAPAS